MTHQQSRRRAYGSRRHERRTHGFREPSEAVPLNGRGNVPGAREDAIVPSRDACGDRSRQAPDLPESPTPRSVAWAPGVTALRTSPEDTVSPRVGRP